MGAERSPFIINGQGKLQAILRKVKPAEHAQQVIDALRQP